MGVSVGVGSGEWVGLRFFEWALIDKQVLYCGGIFCEEGLGVVENAKSLKTLKVRTMRPLFGFWVVFVVVIRRGCGVI